MMGVGYHTDWPFYYKDRAIHYVDIKPAEDAPSQGVVIMEWLMDKDGSMGLCGFVDDTYMSNVKAFRYRFSDERTALLFKLRFG